MSFLRHNHSMKRRVFLVSLVNTNINVGFILFVSRFLEKSNPYKDIFITAPVDVE